MKRLRTAYRMGGPHEVSESVHRGCVNLGGILEAQWRWWIGLKSKSKSGDVKMVGTDNSWRNLVVKGREEGW